MEIRWLDIYNKLNFNVRGVLLPSCSCSKQFQPSKYEINLQPYKNLNRN